jgi:hypothetical protein
MLSVDSPLLDEAKLHAAESGGTLSRVVEEYLEYLAYDSWTDLLSKELGLGELEPTAEAEIPGSRPKGWDAARVAGELREERRKAIQGGDQ